MKNQPDHNRITLLVVREAGRPVRQLHLSKPLALALPAVAALSLSSLVTSMHFHASRSIAELEAEAAALQLSNVQMEIQAQDKDKTLQLLRSQVTELSEEADSIKEKLQNVNELERQLQSLIEQEQGTPEETDRNQEASAAWRSPGVQPGSTAVSTAKYSVFAGGSSAAGHLVAPAVRDAAGTAYAGAVLASEALQFRLSLVNAAAGRTVLPQVGGEYIAVYEEDPLKLARETRDDYEEIRSMLDEMLTSISSTITAVEEANQAEAKLAARQKQAEQKRLAQPVLWPTSSKVITSSFGYRSDPFEGVSAYHSGIDIAGNIGDPIYAAMDGTVTASEQMGARGKYIILKHSNGLETWYMHLNGMTVSAGDKVIKGQKIGTLGNTGRSTGPHLHFQVVKQNKPVNPLNYVKP
ncbi:peptidoglycan DD-metalloendopeptidase family protein [Paenibacillus tepidiphilus]|uniref:peptidoglycan DD-metalloendopeptidase family protein n=1 Tax=Paenibacillus tepidiphilus TaxID=2608683 RepID=UPI0023B1C5D7|nr:peptidoglycan DD-metalloendopeptidase family protein [Paenibacillus tepidiphilus]